MTVVPPRNTCKALLTLIVVACAGCGSDDVALALAFRVPEGSQTLATAQRVELVASHGGQRVAFETVTYSSGVKLGLDSITTFDDLTLSVTARDADLAPLAYGVLEPAVTASIEKASESCCLTMCLCSPAYHAGDTDHDGAQDTTQDPCTCGSTACTKCE